MNEAAWNALRTVEDPELPLSIVDMGLIYDVRFPTGDGHVEVDMTFTAMGCPAMDMLIGDVKEALAAVEGIEDVDVRVVWNPPWTKSRLSERARAVLLTAGVSV